MTELRFALRGLLKSPGFPVVSVLTLALGIGACRRSGARLLAAGEEGTHVKPVEALRTESKTIAA